MGSGKISCVNLRKFFLLKFALNKGLRAVLVFGDSLLIINWMTKQPQVQCIGLLEVPDHVKKISRRFQNIYFTRVYREYNQVSRNLSMEGLHLEENHFSLLLLEQFVFYGPLKEFSSSGTFLATLLEGHFEIS